MAKTPLSNLLQQLDAETRERWENYLKRVDDEVEEKGPVVAREHLEAALEHLLAVGWALHRCYHDDDSQVMLDPLGDVAHTIERLRHALDQLAKKPEWSQ